MKKKVISALLCASMVATMVGGCGSTQTKKPTTEKTTEKATEAPTEAVTTEAPTEEVTTEAETTEAPTEETTTEETTTEETTTEETTTEETTTEETTTEETTTEETTTEETTTEETTTEETTTEETTTEETTTEETTTEETTTEETTTEETTTEEVPEGGLDLTKVEAKEAYNFEIVSKGFQHQYWQAVKKGAEEEAKKLGVTMNFVGPNSESDIADQVQMLNSAVNAKPAAIGLAALSTDACIDAIKQAQEAGIPIVGFDSGVPGAPEGAIVANAATDNYAAGELVAEESYKVLKDRIAAAEGSVRIGVMGQDATSESIVNRGLGFIDKIAELAAADGFTVTVEGNDKYVEDCKVEKADDAKVVIEVAVPSQVTAELSATDCQTLLNKDDTICIYGSNQHSGEAMVTGNENLQKFGSEEGQVLGVTFDSGTVIKEAVKSGTLYGAVTQAPVAMGAAVIDLLTLAANGEEVADVDTGCQWYTAENIEDPEIAQNLYD